MRSVRRSRPNTRRRCFVAAPWLILWSSLIGICRFEADAFIVRPFSCSSSSSSTTTKRSRITSPAAAARPLQNELLDRAALARGVLGQKPPSYYAADDKSQLSQALFFGSSYSSSSSRSRNKEEEDHERGFCNWLIPGHVMIGQYPGQTPEKGGCTQNEAEQHMARMVVGKDARVRLFCSLQSELPAQDDSTSWNRKDGLVFLEPESLRRQFPRPFTHYAPVIVDLCSAHSTVTRAPPRFLHAPIEDLNVPESQEPLQELLLELLTYLTSQQQVEDGDSNRTTIYLHCWGGRGRAGLVGACLLSLIWPSLSDVEVLDWVQTGYASRKGHDRMPSALSQSPQTSTQRDFVQQFVLEYQRLYGER